MMLGALAAATWAVGVRAADSDGLKSGPQCGEAVTPFQVKDITGPNKGKQLCYR